MSGQTKSLAWHMTSSKKKIIHRLGGQNFILTNSIETYMKIPWLHSETDLQINISKVWNIDRFEISMSTGYVLCCCNQVVSCFCYHLIFHLEKKKINSIIHTLENKFQNNYRESLIKWIQQPLLYLLVMTIFVQASLTTDSIPY